MSKFRFSKHQVAFMTVLILIIVILAIYNKGMKESFDMNNLNLQGAFQKLQKNMTLPNTVLPNLNDIPVISQKLNFSSVKEPFYGMGDLAISSFAKANQKQSSKNWSNPNLTYSSGGKLSQGSKNILKRPPQPIPLPPGQLDMFATTEFKPSCCPNTFSSSTGCACMTVNQYKYLVDRGGNNVPYSEY